MKKLVLAIAIIMAGSFVQAQKLNEKEVPAPVKSTFQQKYAHIKSVKWEKEHGNYEAGFKDKGVENSVLLDASGNILEIETEIKVHQLPQGAKAYVEKNHKGQKIKEASKIINNKGEVTYEAEVNGKDLIFDPQGKFLKEVKD